jgi:hypothetical protein
MQKPCTHCKTEKPFDDFYFDKREGRGYKSICKDCENLKKKVKRTQDWKLENQPISLFISAFRKRFGDHENFSDEFIELYRQAIKLKAQIKNKESKSVMIKNNFVCTVCGAVTPLEFPMEVKRLAKLSDLFIELHKEC